MPLQLHLSSRSEELWARLRPALAGARLANLALQNGIPRPVPVLVPSAQLGDWLQVRLARDLGLSMGFSFLPPDDFFSTRLSGYLAGDFAAAHAAWRPAALRWRLLGEVEALAGPLGYAEPARLTLRDRFACACLLAGQLDRTLRHRLAWAGLWRRGQAALPASASAAARADETWQRELWRKVAALPGMPPHPTEWLAGSLASRPAVAAPAPGGAPIGSAASASGSAPLGGAASRVDAHAADHGPVFFVATGQLDPLALACLQALERSGHAVAVFVLLPSLGFLGDLPRRPALRKLARATAAEEPLPVPGHPLLVSLGQQAVGNFLLLDALDPHYAAWPSFGLAADEVAGAGSLAETVAGAGAGAGGRAGATQTVLHRLQADIRLQQAPLGAPGAAEFDLRPPLPPGDYSLRVHACHSPRRELEVLQDELWRAFAELPGLKPEDVLIGVTDFDAYAPLAEGILRSGEQRLPVRLTAIPAREANPVAVGLLELLRLALGRQSVSELLALLTLSAVQQHLGVAEEAEQTERLRDQLRHSGLTHALDETQRESGTLAGTWRAALDRWLAGFWLGNEAAAQDAQGDYLHPLADDLASGGDLQARFWSWLTQLAVVLQDWRTPATAATWATRLTLVVDTLLHADTLDDHAAACRRRLGELGQAGDTPLLDVGAVLDWWQPLLENATSLRTSLGGEILFGRLDQVQGLPCRVLAVLGLQDGAFPRAQRTPAWDLLAARPERWDLSTRQQDKQYFLDAVLAPRDRLVLTAANRSLRSPHDGALSSCVEELLRAVRATFRWDEPPGAVHPLIVLHRIQPFAREYFVPAGDAAGPARSYHAGAARIAADLAAVRVASGEPEPFFEPAPLGATAGAAATATITASAATTTPAAIVRELSLRQLIAFWQDPAAAWLKALGVAVERATVEDTLLDDPPLSLDTLQAYGVRSAALEARLAYKPAVAGDGAVGGQGGRGDAGGVHVGDFSGDRGPTLPRLIAQRELPPAMLGAFAWEIYDGEIAALAAGVRSVVLQAQLHRVRLQLPTAWSLQGEIHRLSGVGPGGGEAVLFFRAGKLDSPKYQLDAWLHTLLAAAAVGVPMAAVVYAEDFPQGRWLAAVAPEVAHAQLVVLVDGYAAGQAAPVAYAPVTSDEMVPHLDDPGRALDKAAQAWFKRSAAYGGVDGEGLAKAAALVWRERDPFAAPTDEAWLSWTEAVALPLARWWATGVNNKP